ncbi:MAG: TlpA family protein disulfide reductase [Acidobacteria bacterium]|nr:TlpA family protein disulfide reductase [Acidobacteriota bacterium]
MHQRIICGLILLIIGVTVFYSLYRLKSNRARTNILGAGDLIPDFQLSNDLGEQVTRESLAGKKYAFLFYRTDCIYCHAELEQMNELQTKYAGRLIILPVSLRSSAEKPGYEEQQVTHYRGVKQLAERLGVGAVPTFVLVGEDSRIAYGYSGGRSYQFQEFIIDWFLEGKDMKEGSILKAYEKHQASTSRKESE